MPGTRPWLIRSEERRHPGFLGADPRFVVGETNQAPDFLPVLGSGGTEVDDAGEPAIRPDFEVIAGFIGAGKGTCWATGDDPVAAVFYFFQFVDFDWHSNGSSV